MNDYRTDDPEQDDQEAEYFQTTVPFWDVPNWRAKARKLQDQLRELMRRRYGS